MAQFLWGLGLSENEVECYDVYGLDEELLAMVPNPVLAVLFLYPLTSQVCPLKSVLFEASRNLFNENVLF